MLVLALALVVAAALPARAEYVYDSFGVSNVTIDLRVLDRLGPAPTVPDSRFVLRAPNGSRIAQRQAAPRRVAHSRIQRIGSVTIDYSALPPAGALAASDGPRIALHLPGTQTVAAAVPPASSGPQGPSDSTVKPPLGNAVAAAPTPPPAPAPAAPPNMPQVAALPPSFTGFSRLVPAATPPDNTPAPEPGAALAATPPPASPVDIPKSDSGAVRFAPGAADLGGDARTVLDTIAQKLSTQPGERIQLVAYASAPGSGEDDAIEARRTSLARAVVVRAYLIQHGVASARIDVRALGNRAEGSGSLDRVDLMMLGS